MKKDELVSRMEPVLEEGSFTFRSLPPGVSISSLKTFATVSEEEGVTVIAQAGDEIDRPRWRKITLQVFSDLAAVGLTAAVSAALAKADISCNVVSGFHHDHLFVPEDRAEEALQILLQLQADSKRLL